MNLKRALSAAANLVRRSLIVQITVPTVLVVLALSLVSSRLLGDIFARTHESHAAERASRFADAMEDAFRREMTSDHAEVDSFLQLICRATGKSAFVTDRERRVRFTCDQSLADQVIDLPPEGGTDRVTRQDTSWVRQVHRLEGGPECGRCHDGGGTRGYIGIEVPTREADEEVSEQRQMNLLAGGVLAAGLCILLVLVQVLLVHRPVTALTQTVDRIRAGDLSARLPTTRVDQLGRLAASLNAMAASIEQAKVELARTHRAELAQSEKLAALGQLTSSIAHEIKNPLAGIIGALKVVESETAPDHPDKPVLAKILAQMERLSQTAVSLLDYAKPLEAAEREVDVTELLDRALFFVERQAAAQGVTIRRRYAGGLPATQLDPDLMKQVFLNLVLNAVQAMPDGGTLEVAVRADGGAVEVVVADQGVGIPAENLDRVFAPFFTTKPRGTGLGLYVARQIVETQRGQIRVASQPGKGTSFTLRLPAAPTAGRDR